MYKKTLTYTDYDGETRTEDFYFNLSKAEIIDMQLSVNGGFDSYIKKIISTKDSKELVSLFKELICKSYGEKSLDGRKFVKNQQVLDDFVQTEAYSDFYMLLATNDKEAVAFMKGIFPNIEGLDDKISSAVDDAKKLVEAK